MKDWSSADLTQAQEGTAVSKRPIYLPEIDGLRAIAVLAVVFYHAGFGVGAGLVGVDVFFVISGYLITGLLRDEWLATGRIDLFAFYARRVRRLLPALFVLVAGTVALSMWLLAESGRFKPVAESAAAALLFLGNFYFQHKTGGYFDPSTAAMPLQHLWSLAVEEQFYLVWPLALLALLKRAPARLALCIAVLCVASLALAEALLFFDAEAAFYQMPARFWELAVGGWIACRPAQVRADGRWLAGFGTVLVLVASCVPIAHFPGLGALPAVAGAACLIYAVHVARSLGWAGAFLRSRPMVFFGLISYSLYLWHWPLLALDHASRAGEAPAALRAVMISLAVVLAWVSYKFVEQPFRRGPFPAPPPKLVAAGLTLSLAAACLMVALGDELHRAPPATDLASRTESDQPTTRVACHYRGDMPLDDLRRAACVSDPGKPVRVAIWGDSHALAWQPFAWRLAEANGVAAVEYTRDACPPIRGVDNGKPALEAGRCREFNDLVAARVDGLDLLVMTAFWPSNAQANDYADHFDATLDALAPRVGRVLLLGLTPTLRDAAPQCIRTKQLAECARARAEFDASAKASAALLQAAAARHSNVEYVPLSDFFCNATTCPVLKDGYALYWDDDHVSSTAARAFADDFMVQGASPGSVSAERIR
jgi:peptidoglycan/LPS O-acetylase OafA/YrhL